VVKETKGTFINKPEEVFEGKLEREYKKINLTTPLLIISILLFMLDIAYRRLNLDFIKLFNKNKNKIKKEKENSNIINKEKNKKENIFREDTTTLNKESKNKAKIISLENNDIKDNIQEDIREEIGKAKKVKKTKKQENKKDNKQGSLDTSALLKKKSDRKKI
ncbi:MAG: hypothetical protein ACI33I_13885, partial [Clostridium sp.]